MSSEKKFPFAIEECALSERSYLESLRDLDSTICRVSDKWYPADNLLGIPSHDISDILLVNESLLNAWTSPNLTIQSLATAFQEFCAVAPHVYRSFINHYAFREVQFKRLKDNHSDDNLFRVLYSRIGDKIILPIQRVMRYPMLFEAAIATLEKKQYPAADIAALRTANTVALEFAALCDEAQSQSAKFILLKQVCFVPLNLLAGLATYSCTAILRFLLLRLCSMSHAFCTPAKSS